MNLLERSKHFVDIILVIQERMEQLGEPNMHFWLRASRCERPEASPTRNCRQIFTKYSLGVHQGNIKSTGGAVRVVSIIYRCSILLMQAEKQVTREEVVLELPSFHSLLCPSEKKQFKSKCLAGSLSSPTSILVQIPPKSSHL